MILEQLSWTTFHKWQTKLIQTTDNFKPQLVFVFGSRKVLSDIELIKELQARYPLSQLIGCSTSGEIIGTEVNDDSLAVTAVFFEKTSLQFSFLDVQESIVAPGNYLLETATLTALELNNAKQISVSVIDQTDATIFSSVFAPPNAFGW